jgi:hypothetical protein
MLPVVCSMRVHHAINRQCHDFLWYVLIVLVVMAVRGMDFPMGLVPRSVQQRDAVRQKHAQAGQQQARGHQGQHTQMQQLLFEQVHGIGQSHAEAGKAA